MQFWMPDGTVMQSPFYRKVVSLHVSQLSSALLYLTQFLFILVVLFILPGYRFLVINFGVFPVVRKYMIDPYYAEHPDDDIELRRRLGLIKEEYSEEDLL